MTVLLFVSGDRSQVGKSTTCLGLLGALLGAGFSPAQLGYIKPATQCEDSTLVARFCKLKGIDAVPIGPIVFFSGFTRSFLAGDTPSSAEMLANVKTAVDSLSSGKAIVLVDGVGYPAVGSICGVDNGSVAATLGAPVLLVGKRGVGDAIDSHNLNTAWFSSKGVPVLGAVFNRFPDDDSYYGLTKCTKPLNQFFAQSLPTQKLYGLMSELDVLKKKTPEDGAGAGAGGGEGGDEADATIVKAVVDEVEKRLNVLDIVADAAKAMGLPSPVPVSSASPTTGSATTETTPDDELVGSAKAASAPPTPLLSREAIEAAAKADGAACGS